MKGIEKIGNFKKLGKKIQYWLDCHTQVLGSGLQETLVLDAMELGRMFLAGKVAYLFGKLGLFLRLFSSWEKICRKARLEDNNFKFSYSCFLIYMCVILYYLYMYQ